MYIHTGGTTSVSSAGFFNGIYFPGTTVTLKVLHCLAGQREVHLARRRLALAEQHLTMSKNMALPPFAYQFVWMLHWQSCPMVFRS